MEKPSIAKLQYQIDYYLTRRLAPYLPFLTQNTVWQKIDKEGRSVLDIGCGTGETTRFIFRHGHQNFTVGADIFLPYLIECQKNQIHDQYVQCNASVLPFNNKSFDIVLGLEVVEHLDKDDALKLISNLESIARNQVIISTPVGEFGTSESDGNKWTVHRSSFMPSELRRLGYQVRGYSLRGSGGTHGYLSRIPWFPKLIVRTFIYLSSPLVYWFPSLASDMICIKKIQ